MPVSLLNKNNRIARQLLLSVVLASVLITLSTTAYQLYGHYAQQRQLLENRLDEIGLVHVSNLTNDVWIADQKHIKGYLVDIFNLPDIQFLQVSEADKTLVQVGEKQTGASIERSFPLIHRYRGQDIQLGELYLQATLDDIYRSLFKQFIYILSSNALAIFVLAGVVLFLFDRLMARHVHTLAVHAAGLSIHNMDRVPVLDKPTKPGVSDELDTLVEAFARMQASLLDSINAVTNSEARTRLILDSATEAMYGLDLDGRCSFVNPACINILGYSSADELIGMHMHRLIHHSYADGSPYPKSECQIFKAVASGEIGHSDQEILWRADGSSFPVEWWSHPIQQDGKLTGAVVTFFDISQRLQAEAALRDAHQLEVDARLTAVVDTAIDGIITISEQGIVETYNWAAAVLFGYTADEVIGKNIKMLMPERYAAEHDQYLANYRRTGQAKIIGSGREVTGQRKDGSTFPMELSVVEVKLSERRIFTGMVRDITERQTAQASLTQFKATLDQTLDCVFMFTADDLSFFYVNRGAEKQVGYTQDELVTMTPVDLKPEFDEQQFRAILSPLLANEKSSITFETLHRHKDGHSIPVEISLQYIPRENEAGHFIAIVRDVTERRQIQDALLKAKSEAEQASRAKSAFLAAMSHEIRTPMNGVIGMVEILAHSKLDEDQADAIATIRDSAFSLLGLIDDILDFSKIEAGRLELERLPVSVTDTVEGVCNTLAPVAVNSDVDLYLFISPQVPNQVWLDPTRLRQVLYNLVGNAIKFSAQVSQQGRVEVRVNLIETTPLQLIFSITDNGIGMTPETQANLFTSFNQAETSTTRRFGGTGLGLAISGRLVKLMDGKINVASTYNTGSCFTVTVPVDLVAESSSPSLPDLSGLECIIVSDPHIKADDLRIYLEHAGAQVQQAQDLDQARRQAARLTTPAVVLHSARSTNLSIDTVHATFAGIADVCHLLITGGKRRSARLAAPNVVTLDGDALRRQALLRAVAVAAGRASPEIFHPQTNADIPTTEASPPTVAEARAQGRLILVAEDDMINRKVILMQLALLGYAAEVACNGAEALHLWREGQYALLLTDLHMPEMDGYQLAQAIRQQEAGQRHMPILALTANALLGEEKRAKQAGIDDYLTKPVQLQLLTETLSKWLNGTGQTANALPAVTDSEPVALFDSGVLKALVGDDPDTLDELLTDYLDSAKQLAQDLRTAFRADDINAIGGVAHKLKSSSRSVGALPLGDLCAEIENACTTRDHASIALLMAQSVLQIEAVETEIVKYLDTQGAGGTKEIS